MRRSIDQRLGQPVECDGGQVFEVHAAIPVGVALQGGRAVGDFGAVEADGEDDGRSVAVVFEDDQPPVDGGACLVVGVVGDGEFLSGDEVVSVNVPCGVAVILPDDQVAAECEASFGAGGAGDQEFDGIIRVGDVGSKDECCAVSVIFLPDDIGSFCCGIFLVGLKGGDRVEGGGISLPDIGREDVVFAVIVVLPDDTVAIQGGELLVGFHGRDVVNQRVFQVGDVCGVDVPVRLLCGGVNVKVLPDDGIAVDARAVLIVFVGGDGVHLHAGGVGDVGDPDVDVAVVVVFPDDACAPDGWPGLIGFEGGYGDEAFGVVDQVDAVNVPVPLAVNFDVFLPDDDVAADGGGPLGVD